MDKLTHRSQNDLFPYKNLINMVWEHLGSLEELHHYVILAPLKLVDTLCGQHSAEDLSQFIPGKFLVMNGGLTSNSASKFSSTHPCAEHICVLC